MTFEARHKKDRTGMEMLDAAMMDKVRDNFTKWTLPYMPEKERVSTASVAEIMTCIAQYAGRIEVSGLGSFFIREVEQRPITDANGNFVKMRSARRFIDFTMSATMRDMVNNDYNYQSEPDPNPDYFVERRNLLI